MKKQSIKFSNSLIAILWLVFVSHDKVIAKDYCRIMVLNMPIKETAAVRAMLKEPTKGSKPETMDAVLKLPGLSVMAEFKQEDPWGGVAKQFSKPMGEIEIGGIQVSELGVNVRLQGSRSDNVVEEMLQWEMTLPLGGKKYHFLQNLGNVMVVSHGRWQERASWGNAEEAWMLWQFSTIHDEKLRVAKSKNIGQAAVFVEMCWFQASPSDLASLGQSKPETREKAFHWLAARAKRWRECSFRMRTNSKAIWGENEGKYELQGKEPVAKEDRFSIEGGFAAQGEQLKMECEVMSRRKGKDVTRNLVSTHTPGIWEFIAIDGLPDANVVACRLSN